MYPRHKKPPKIWLMTDPRIGGALLAAVQALRAGSGVIFRHYEYDAAMRRALFRRVRRICARRGHSLFLAGDEPLARRWGAQGCHSRDRPPLRSPPSCRTLPRSAPVHNLRELARARRARADFVFISPIYATRSHPAARAMGPAVFRRLAMRAGRCRVIALGGMTAAKAAMQNRRVVHGWAGIDAFAVGAHR